MTGQPCPLRSGSASLQLAEKGVAGRQDACATDACATTQSEQRPTLGQDTMKVTYDKEADALYIQLLKGEYECRVVRLTDDVALDFAAGEKLVGVEVLGASRLFDTPDSPEIELKDLAPKKVSA